MFSFQPFSKPRLVSIGLLLAILVISLMFSSYVEGMSENTDAVDIVNKDAPLTKDLSTKDLSKDLSKDLKPFDGIDLGASKTLSVSDVTGILKNNAGVQKLIDNAQKLPNSK